MKKIIAAVLMLMLIVTACACASQAPAPTPTSEAALATPTQTPTQVPTEVPVETPTLEPTTTPTTAPTPEPTPVIDITKTKTMYVTGSSVNVRAEASTNAPIVKTVKYGAEIQAYTQIGEWYAIKHGTNKIAYIYGKYISETAPAPKTPVALPTQKPSDHVYKSSIDINDNVFLDALEYTGYNLAKHRADGNMWVFILGKYKQGLGYLSGLGYDYGASTGYETNAEGKPDIARFKKKGGLVCASYLTYVYFNYLPNVAGIDTSFLTRPEYPCSAQSWRLAARDWVAKGYSRKISFTAKRYSSGNVSFSPSEDIPIGSVVVFKVYGASDSSAARHVTLYAGYAGGYHWLTHVGNERGPEMITIENMGFGSTPEIPVEVITPPIDFSKYVK